MKTLNFLLLVLPLTLGPVLLTGQNHNIFNGGNGDGFSQANYVEPLNNSIFGGRNADGFSFIFYTAQLNNTVYAGGNADGFASMSFAQALNNGIFTGGDADGFSFMAYTQPLNNGIFAGGNTDGFSNRSYAQPLNNNIFAGGNADGHSTIAHAQPLNNSIFSGGDGDGFDLIAYQMTFNEVAIKVILQGPYVPSQNSMRTDLSGLPGFPLIEPYTDLGYVLQNKGATIQLTDGPAGTEIVDWIVIELRDLINHGYYARAALLLKNGTVVDTQLSPSVKFRNIPTGNYHLLIRHRNHLGVMTDGTITINNN